MIDAMLFVVLMILHLVLLHAIPTRHGTTARSLTADNKPRRRLGTNIQALLLCTGTIRKQPPECHTVEQYKGNAVTCCADLSFTDGHDTCMKGIMREWPLSYARQCLVSEPCHLGVE